MFLDLRSTIDNIWSTLLFFLEQLFVGQKREDEDRHHRNRDYIHEEPYNTAKLTHTAVAWLLVLEFQRVDQIIDS